MRHDLEFNVCLIRRPELTYNVFLALFYVVDLHSNRRHGIGPDLVLRVP